MRQIQGSINIDAPVEQVWDALTDPEKVQIYTGSLVKTDWKPGSAILWEGQQGERKYEDRGKVLVNETNKRLSFEYWSGIGGDPRTPENMSVITFTLNESEKGVVTLAYMREKIPTDMEKMIFAQHLPEMLKIIKHLVESGQS